MATFIRLRQHAWMACEAKLVKVVSILDTLGSVRPSPIHAGVTTLSVPAVTADELVMVFGSGRGGTTGVHGLYYSVRATRDEPFPTPQQIPGIESEFRDSEGYLSPDGCELYFSSIRTGSDYEIYDATYVQQGS
jgi:hypothetical protein